MSAIRREDVEAAARLARLRLEPEEARALAADLDAILEHVAALEAIDVSAVPPTAHVLPLRAPLRADRPQPSLAPQAALRNAPASDGTAFTVPGVLEGEEEG